MQLILDTFTVNSNYLSLWKFWCRIYPVYKQHSNWELSIYENALFIVSSEGIPFDSSGNFSNNSSFELENSTICFQVLLHKWQMLFLREKISSRLRNWFTWLLKPFLLPNILTNLFCLFLSLNIWYSVQCINIYWFNRNLNQVFFFKKVWVCLGKRYH